MKLSDDLKKWRAERPDEWTMDRFIKQATEIEQGLKIVAGWCFMSADFSVQASGKYIATGSVTLVREPTEKAKWHKMTEEDKEDENGPELYVVGHGMTIEDAIRDANQKAVHAKPINEDVSGSSARMTGCE